jgi:hypothetical protein
MKASVAATNAVDKVAAVRATPTDRIKRQRLRSAKKDKAKSNTAGIKSVYQAAGQARQMYSPSPTIKGMGNSDISPKASARQEILRFTGLGGNWIGGSGGRC